MDSALPSRSLPLRFFPRAIGSISNTLLGAWSQLLFTASNECNQLRYIHSDTYVHAYTKIHAISDTHTYIYIYIYCKTEGGNARA